METGKTGAGARPDENTRLEEAAWSIHEGRAEDAYQWWPAPDLIISDGAYGIGGFPGDPPTPTELPAWYSPHIKAWTEPPGRPPFSACGTQNSAARSFTTSLQPADGRTR